MNISYLDLQSATFRTAWRAECEQAEIKTIVDQVNSSAQEALRSAEEEKDLQSSLAIYSDYARKVMQSMQDMLREIDEEAFNELNAAFSRVGSKKNFSEEWYLSCSAWIAFQVHLKRQIDQHNKVLGLWRKHLNWVVEEIDHNIELRRSVIPAALKVQDAQGREVDAQLEVDDACWLFSHIVKATLSVSGQNIGILRFSFCKSNRSIFINEITNTSIVSGKRQYLLVGTRLIELLKQLGRELGYRKLKVQAQRTNHTENPRQNDPVAFYNKMGFVRKKSCSGDCYVGYRMKHVLFS